MFRAVLPGLALLLAVLPLLLAAPVAGFEAVSRGPDGLAIAGYDATGYHRDGTARPGLASHEVEWNGAVWRFARAEDAALFRADPAAYAPAFGGHCANGLAEGHLVSGDPEIWLIHEGRLFLFHAPRGLRIWTLPDADVPALIGRAEATWARLQRGR